MEIKKETQDPTQLNSYIKIFDDVMPKKILNNFKKICKEHGRFGTATLAGGKNEPGFTDLKTRKTDSWPLQNLNCDSKTDIHWCNLLMHLFSTGINNYAEFYNCPDIECTISDIQVLRYFKTYHYKFHVDHGAKIPRTISAIFFVNEDYEGGELMFKTPDRSKDLLIEKKENRMILWPSNFLYPHSVLPVKKGVRYSVVAWAL
jgi:hypothetical protein